MTHSCRHAQLHRTPYPRVWIKGRRSDHRERLALGEAMGPFIIWLGDLQNSRRLFNDPVTQQRSTTLEAVPRLAFK